MHEQQQQQRVDWTSATSPIPPDWTADHAHHGKLRVDPAVHSRVRVLSAKSYKSSGGAIDNQVNESDNDDDDDDDDMEYDDESDAFQDNNNSSASTAGEGSGLSARFSPLPLRQLVAPEPRRVVSPELIFSSAAESLARHKRLRFVASPARGTKGLVLPRASHFRPIVADRPDVEITSPPMRSINPVAMDSRFQHLTPLDAQHDPPLQPLYPRATRRCPSTTRS